MSRVCDSTICGNIMTGDECLLIFLDETDQLADQALGVRGQISLPQVERNNHDDQFSIDSIGKLAEQVEGQATTLKEETIPQPQQRIG
ncbi:hypothetical protein CEP53_011486 [Fusarium sp. AF-6]|nr:hypothetical protein CEP53_011486 [Fusarium sp. AF-6]